MNKISFLVLFFTVIIFQVGIAQPKFKLYPDSIRVEMPEQNGLVVFEIREFPKNQDVIRNFGKTLKEILETVRKSTSPDQAKEPLHIEVRTGPEGQKEVGLGVKPFGEKRELTIRPSSPLQTTVTMTKERGIVEMLPPGWEVLMMAKDHKVKVYAADFSSLEKIADQDFGLVADAIAKDAGIVHMGRKSIESRMILRNSQVDEKTVSYVHPGDNIFLAFQAGIGLYQNIIYPELSFKMGLTFKDRMRRPNFRTTLIATRLYFAEQTSEGFQSYSNSFLSGSFEVNFDRKSGKTSWSGLGIGFLVNRSGNYFLGNTAKIFVTHTIPGSRFSMVPEFYLTDDFKKFTFGMTLKYSF